MIVEQTNIRRKQFSMLRVGPCSISQAVAIGGGGSSNNDEGSGSGYVTFDELTATDSFLRYEAMIGSADNPTSITNIASGKVVLEAQPGRGGRAIQFHSIIYVWSPFLALFQYY